LAVDAPGETIAQIPYRTGVGQAGLWHPLQETFYKMLALSESSSLRERVVRDLSVTRVNRQVMPELVSIDY